MKKIELIIVLFLSFTAFLIGCEMTENVILTSPIIVDESEGSVYPVTEELKALIWEDAEMLIDDLIELEEGETNQARRLAVKLQVRQQQDRVYTKWIDAGGIAIIGTRTVEDSDLVIARDITLKMLQKRPELATYLSPEYGFYMILYDPTEQSSVLELPETQLWLDYLNISGPTPSPYGYVGMCYYSGSGSDGHTFACAAPAGKVYRVSTYNPSNKCSGLWCVQELRIRKWSIFIHEMAHAIAKVAFNIESDFHFQVRGRFWAGTTGRLFFKVVCQNQYA